MCKNINQCQKIKMILDKDMENFQYRECAKLVCEKCKEVNSG
jgi:hypothetical protein